MREQSKLLEFINGREQEVFTLVTVLGTEGSTYRKKGAHKIIDASGLSVGLISGGCLEGEIVKHALEMQGETSEFLIDTSADLDRIFGYAIGCSGKITLGFKKMLGSEISSHEYIGFRKDQRLKLMVFGAGPDIDPLYELLKWTKWNIAFYSERSDFVDQRTEEGWPIQKFDSQSLNFNIDDPERTAVAIMSHHYPADIEVLKYFCEKEIGYIGLLGPEKKKQQMISDLQKMYQFQIPEKMQPKVFGPLGINGMGRGETAIALSLVAHLQHLFFNPEFAKNGIKF